jgi:Rrf2 family protein
MLSQRTRYAIRALLHLADRYGKGPVPLNEIAAAQRIPAKFLTVILSELGRAGLVEAQRGKDGGYRLARRPSEITYGDVIRLTRGSLALVPCAIRLAYEPCKNCVTQEQCRLRWVMLQVRDEMARVLDTIRLSDPVPVPLENVAAE